MTSPTKPRRDLRIEGDFLPDELGDLIDLRERIVAAIEAGDVEEVVPKYADSVANGITGWLVAKAAGERDSLSPPTRTRYRKVLAVLAQNDDTPGGRRQAGFIEAALAGHMGGVAAAGAALAAGHPIAAGAIALVSPIIYVM